MPEEYEHSRAKEDARNAFLSEGCTTGYDPFPYFCPDCGQVTEGPEHPCARPCEPLDGVDLDSALRRIAPSRLERMEGALRSIAEGGCDTSREIALDALSEDGGATDCRDCGDPTDGRIVTTDGRFLCATCGGGGHRG